jgi:hypothetical protein
MKRNKILEVPEEVYQELLETERKYLLLIDYLQKLSSSLGDVTEVLNEVLKTK